MPETLVPDVLPTELLKGRILVIDDEADIRESLATLLEMEGYDVEMAPDGGSGLRKLESSNYDLVLLDLMMQYLDGRDELKLMEMGSFNIPVIVVTAFLDADKEADEFRRAGVVHIVYKPFDLDQLVELVKSTIGEP